MYIFLALTTMPTSTGGVTIPSVGTQTSTQPPTTKLTKPSTASTTTETTTLSTTVPSTQPPIVEYVWSFQNLTSTNSVVGNKYSLTVHGSKVTVDGGLAIQNSSQYIDFGKEITCLTNPEVCHQGLTVQFTIKFGILKENTYLLTSGGESTSGIGIAILYRYGRFQFILSTTTHSWFTSCGREIFLSNTYHTIMMSWHGTTGLNVYVDNHFIDSSKVSTKHETTFSTVSTVYFGKPHYSTSSVVKVDYLIKSIHIWYARLDILIIQGICKPPVQGKYISIIVLCQHI